MLLIIKNSQVLHTHLDGLIKKGESIGFVPTMGALHEGHMELIRRSKSATTCTVCSIFVNPTQFNDPRDFQKYPKTIEADIEKLVKEDCDILFLPDVSDLYSSGLVGLESYDLGDLEHVYEGKYRPGHFQGVCQVMSRLLQRVRPQQLFMGLKDYQQCMVVQRLIELLRLETKLVGIPTVREDSGLAMSSRNLRLSEENRAHAAEIYRALQNLCKSIRAGDLQPLLANARQQLSQKGFTVDYIEVADKFNLVPVRNWDGQQQLVALAAVFLQEERLIDNVQHCID